MSKPKWDKVDKSTWTRGAYRIERRARDQFVALGPPGEGDNDETPGHLGCWGKLALAKAACDEHEAGLGEGEPTTLELAQQACQEHHRELVGPPEIGERDVKPEKPAERELREWSIPVPLSDDELAEHRDELADLVERIGLDTVAIADIKDSAKRRVKGLEAGIETATKKALDIAGIVKAKAEHRLVKCLRLVVEGEEIFIDPDNDKEIHRAAVPDQGQLWGGDRPPPEPAPIVAEVDLGSETPAGEQAADEIADPLPPHLDLSNKRNWQRLTSGAYVTSEPEGDHYRINKSGGLWQVSLYLDKRRRELPGKHHRLKDAFAAAHADNQRRLRWPGDPDSPEQLDSSGRYQVSRRLTAPGYTDEAVWQAQHIGGQDELNTDLGEHDDLPAAQAACQRHADAGRAGQ